MMMLSDNIAILYVEDDAQSREVMEVMVLEVLGLSHLTVFEDSHNFLARVDQIRPAPKLILLDIHVRPHNGFEMLKLLRQSTTWAKTPVVALTASVMNEEVQQLKDAGFSGVIAKPIDLDMFPVLLGRILHGESIWYVMN